MSLSSANSVFLVEKNMAQGQFAKKVKADRSHANQVVNGRHGPKILKMQITRALKREVG